MPDLKLLSSLIKKNDKTNDSVAKAIGINRATFYRKLQKNGESFTVEQVREMAKFIPLSSTEVNKIFLRK